MKKQNGIGNKTRNHLMSGKIILSKFIEAFILCIHLSSHQRIFSHGDCFILNRCIVEMA